jgi:hypothetical protein
MDHLESPNLPDTAGCMLCKAPRPYTIEPFANGNTGWRCTVCGTILRLIPGRYSAEVPEAPA